MDVPWRDTISKKGEDVAPITTRSTTAVRDQRRSAARGRLGAIGVTTLVLWATAPVAPADADVVACGDLITEDTTLTDDIGPCPGHGIIVAADDVTVDLNGHTVTGDPELRGAPDKAGVLLRQVSGVTVQNGTIERFDAGVAIMGGGANAVRRVTLRDNVNYRVITGRDAPGDADPEEGPYCDFGDGVAVFRSDGNLIEHNHLVGNGPYSAVALVSDSDANVVSKNRIVDNDILNRGPGDTMTTCGLVNEGGGEGGTARASQDAGVRIEGPGADGNLVEGNQIRRSGLAGVFVNAHDPRSQANNGGNVIRRNVIAETGLRTYRRDYRASGIHFADPSPRHIHAAYGNTIEGNYSSRNLANGMEIEGGNPDHGNVIRDNVVNHNGLDGIHVSPESHHNTLSGNRGFGNGSRADEVSSPYATYDGVDGGDYSPDCDSNAWIGNHFGTVNQGCVSGAGGTGRVGGPGSSGASQGDDGGPLIRGRPGSP